MNACLLCARIRNQLTSASATNQEYRKDSMAKREFIPCAGSRRIENMNVWMAVCRSYLLGYEMNLTFELWPSGIPRNPKTILTIRIEIYMNIVHLNLSVRPIFVEAHAIQTICPGARSLTRTVIKSQYLSGVFFFPARHRSEIGK